MKNKSFFGKYKRLPTKESGKLEFFLFCPFVKKVFFLTKLKNTFSQTFRKSKNGNEKLMTEKKFRKKLGDVRKGFFVWKKEIFVRKGKIENGQRTKKDETEKRRKTKGVSQRCEQRMKKND